jgi:hypothetical protein
MFPRGEAERELRNAGVTVVERVPLFRVEMPRVEIVTRETVEDGVVLQRRELRTPVGTVHSHFRLEKTFGTSWWRRDHYIKGENDYGVLEYLLEDRSYIPEFERFLQAAKRYGEDGYIVGNTEYSPMNLLIYEFLGLERFSFDLLDRPERIQRYYEILREKQRRMFEICADSPAEFILYGGNVSQEAIGAERFRRYFLPPINEFCDVLHGNGKLAGCHLDAPMATLVESVAESRLDVIEAFTPAPTCDVTVGQARKAWKGKILWMNFPSSVHIESLERIRGETLDILRQAAPGDRFLIGITEDIPEEHQYSSMTTINDTLRQYGALPLSAPRLPVSGEAASKDRER